ncbi:MAG: hypothetical protein ACREPL_00220 [Rhodanobacteraceae bacterium]
MVFDDTTVIDIPVDDSVLETWHIQLGRVDQAGALDALQRRLAACVAAGIAECLDPDLRPPSEAQVAYATAIARELGVSLSGEALRYRGAMADFINRFADQFKRRRAQR